MKQCQLLGHPSRELQIFVIYLVVARSTNSISEGRIEEYFITVDQGVGGIYSQ